MAEDLRASADLDERSSNVTRTFYRLAPKGEGRRLNGDEVGINIPRPKCDTCSVDRLPEPLGVPRVGRRGPFWSGSTFLGPWI